MKFFVLPLALVASILASTATADMRGETEGHWGTGWHSRVNGNLDITATNAAEISEVYIKAFLWQDDAVSAECKYISRLDEEGRTTEVHTVSSEPGCPELTSWSLNRLDDHRVKIEFDQDIFDIRKLGAEEILLLAGNREVLPSEADSVNPKTDILGFTIGLTADEFAALATEKGYEQDGDYWIREPFTNAKGQDVHRDKLIPVYAPVVEGVDYEGAGTLQELRRINRPEVEKSMHADAMLALVFKKYGEPTVFHDWSGSREWAFAHTDIENALAEGAACTDPAPKTESYTACSHGLFMSFEVDREQTVVSTDTSLTDRDLERRGTWARTLASIREKLESQISVFENDNTLEF